MISKDIYESLGDKAYSELQKKSKDHKPKMKTIWDNKPWPLRGSYTNQQLKDMGFVKFDGGWKVPQSKFDELSEMILRPLPTGKAKIPNVGKKKIAETVWAFDAEKALELLKEPLLRGGEDDDPDLDCDICGGHGCGAGYDIKDDLARWTEMLNPDADNRPEHLTNDYIQQKIERLKAIVQKYPNGIPDNIDCSGGMSNKKHREWNETKGHDAADVLSDIIGDDSFHDNLYRMGPDEDVRPLIMNWLNPEWRAKQRPGLPEYSAVEDVDFAELYKRARKIYNPLREVKEGDLIRGDFPQHGEKEKVTTPAGHNYTWSEVERGYSLFGRFTYEGGEFTMYYDPQMRQFDNREPIEGDPKAQQVIDSLPDEYFANDEKESVISGIIDMILDGGTEEQLEEGKKFPRTSEFLFVRELEDIKRLAGVYEPYVEEGDGSMGSNISKTANKISNIMKEKNIQPGTPEWFQLWFSKPYLTGEKPYGE